MKWSDIDGWFAWEQFYADRVEDLPVGATIVEIGCWLGRSTAYMATMIKERRPDIKLFAIDPFTVTDEYSPFTELSPGERWTHAFLSNMSQCGLLNQFHLIPEPSLVASSLFEDGSLDMVFIDGSHVYGNVVDDIRAWTPKVKSGGMIAGDDYGKSWLGVVQAVQENVPGYNLSGATWWKRM